MVQISQALPLFAALSCGLINLRALWPSLVCTNSMATHQLGQVQVSTEDLLLLATAKSEKRKA